MNATRDNKGTVLVTGGSGFVGQALCPALKQAGYAPIILSRKHGASPEGVQRMTYEQLADINTCQAVINLAGENIAGGRWTASRKQALRDSRINTTIRLCEWVATLNQAPEVFISGSAIGYYGATGETAATEESPAGQGFAAQLCKDWEQSLSLPDATRQVIIRIGVVLGAQGGALQRMLLPFKLGLGGPIGNGQQWMTWISRHDLVRLILQALEDHQMQGAYNAVAPQPVRNADFAKALAAQLHRPAFMPMPAGVLKILMGEMSELLLDSQKILPKRLEAQGFTFDHPEVKAALAHSLA